MEQRLLWAELRVPLVKFYGLLRLTATCPANSHPWSEAGCRRPCRQGRLQPSLRRELFDFAPQVALATAKRCFQGIVKIETRRDRLVFQRPVSAGYVILIPAGKWHNLINTGHQLLKLYSIYAPTGTPHGTVHETKE